MTEEEIQQLVTPILRERLGRYGFESADVKAGRDYDGDPIIFIQARYHVGAPELDPLRALDAMVAVSDALREKGESRFSHLTHFHPDDVFAEDERPRPKPVRGGSRR